MSQGALDVILIGCLSLAVGVLSKQFVIAHGISLPVHTFMVMVGIIVGAIAKTVEIDLDPMHVKELSPQTGFNIYMGILMFDCAFNTEVHYFRIIARYMVTIAIPLILLIYLLISIMGIGLFPYDLTFRDYTIFMSIILLPGPHMMRAYLAPTNIQIDLKALLEAEALFGNYIAYMIFRTALFNESYLKSFTIIIADLIIGGLVGYLAGKIMVYWISKIFKDYVNQTTIVLAFIYTGFAMSFLLGTSGFLCVVVMGLVLSDRRASMSTQFIQILNTLLELFVFCLTSFTCVSAGIYCMTIIARIITITEVIVTIAIFLIQNLARALMILVAYRWSLDFLQTKTNAGIIWACNIRGSYSLMMAHTLLDDNFRLEHGKTMYTLVILQIMFSFFVNSVICSYVIGYLNEDNLSRKRWMIERAGQLMIVIRRSTIHSLRNSVINADADWAMVAKQTRLKEDFIKAYRYSRWLNIQDSNRSPRKMLSLLKSGIELRAEATRQIILSQKACYTRLFSEGILSKQSVINLMYHVNQCIKMKKLLVPDDVIKTKDKKSFMTRLEIDLIDQLQTEQPPLLARILIFTVFGLDIVVIVYAILYTIFDYSSSKKLFLITLHNFCMFTGYCCVVVFFMIKTMSFRPLNIWHYLHRVIVLVTFIDLMITAYPIMLIKNPNKDIVYAIISKKDGEHYEKIYIVISTFCTFTRFIRSLQLLQLVPMLQIYVLGFVTHMHDREMFIQCDMATGYYRGIVETMRKLSTMLTDRDLLREMRYTYHKYKLEVSQHLCLAQHQNAGVTTALKTKTALRLTLNALELALEEIKETGVLGLTDAALVHRDILTKMIGTQNFQYSMNPCFDRSILANIPWLANDQDSLIFVEKTGRILHFYTNDIIVSQGNQPAGIFVILRGVVRVECLRSVDEDDENYKREPYYVIKKTSSASVIETDTMLELVNFCTRGNIIGERAFLAEKPGHKTYRCATFVEAFFITNNDMVSLVNRHPYPLSPLSPMEMRMWKTVSIRLAVRIIHKAVSSSNLSRIEIFSRMSESYLVDGNAVRMFTAPLKETSVIVLIQGFAKNFHSDHVFMGPCLIPYPVQKLISLPEIGPHVVYLVVKSNTINENPLEGLVAEDTSIIDEEDEITISSASSSGEPYFRKKEYVVTLNDESDVIARLQSSDIPTEIVDKVQGYEIRKRTSTDTIR